MRIWMLGAALLALQPGLVLAQDGGERGGMGARMIPQTRAEVEAMVKARFARMDTNGDGVVTRAEYDAFRAERMAQRGGDRPPPPEGAPPPPPGGGMGRGDWFARNDRDGDGKVTLAEAMAIPMEMFDRADTNHDGRLSDKERAAAMEMMHDRRMPPPGQ